MNIHAFVHAALIADGCRRPDDAVSPPVIRVSRIEAILADVFEKGLTAMAPRPQSGQVYQQAA